jgi:acyl-CoA synthetase (AMP-forming)/AMP-acid ligase II
MPAASPTAPSILALAERNAARHPKGLAVAGPAERCTWSELVARLDAVTATLAAHELRPGDRICLCLPSAPVWVAAFLAARRLGLVTVSTGDRARPAELDALIERFNVRLILTTPEGHSVRPEPVDGRARSTSAETKGALIHLTSGSSGTPKGVLRTEPDLAEEASNVASALGLTPDDAVLCATPVYHSFASGLLTACLAAGTPCLLMDRLAPAALLDLARREGATLIAGVPYVYQTLAALSTGASLPALRLAISGGAHLHDETASRFRKRFGAPLVQEYGLSEAGIVTLNLDGPAASVGAPIPNVALRIADPEDASRDLPLGVTGEVVALREAPPAGYLDHPGETAATFTPYGIRTGDLGQLDAEGRLVLTGRIKSMINVAGAKVAPREVEEALLAHPAVSEAVACGIPDDALGEAVAAAVVAHDAIDEPSLRAHCRALLSAYKVPACICVEPDLPRTASGKPDLPRIRREFAPRRLP